MRGLVLLPIVFCSLAQAKDFTAAILYDDGDYEFEVGFDVCTNLKRTQPTFTQLEIGYSNACSVYDKLKCENVIEKFAAGEHNITTLKFKSIKCEGIMETMADEFL